MPPPSSPTSSTDDPRRHIDDLISRSLAYRTGPELRKLLEFSRKFPHIAPFNALLLHVQNPGIAYALRASVWESKYQRRIQPAAHPYVILRTMGPVQFVFDLSDTEPIDPAIDLVPESVRNPFPAKGPLPPGALVRLLSACTKIGVQVQWRDYATHRAGQVQANPQRIHAFHIALNSKHSDTQQFGTLAHELGHIFCGHFGFMKGGFWDDRSGTDSAVAEFEAETVAYLVTDRLNLDIGSVGYLSRHLSEQDPLPEYSLDTVLKAAGKIEAMLQGRYRPRKTPPSAPRVP